MGTEKWHFDFGIDWLSNNSLNGNVELFSIHWEKYFHNKQLHTFWITILGFTLCWERY